MLHSNLDQTTFEIALLKHALIDYTNSFSQHPNTKLPENIVYYLIAFLKSSSKEELCQSLINFDENEKLSLLKYLNDRRGLDYLNESYRNQVFALRDADHGIYPLDPFLINNLQTVISLITASFDQELKNGLISSPNLKDLPKVTFSQMDELCQIYLITIDPTLKWLEIYEDAKREGNIIFKEENEGVWETVYEQNHFVIIAPLSNTILDVTSMIHELGHYISLINIDQEEKFTATLKEFTSLFFEKDVIAFLLTQGFSEKDASTLERQRQYWVQEDCLAVIPFLLFLEEYLEKEEITSLDLLNYRKRISSIPKGNISLPSEEINDDKINEECLTRNIFITKNSDTILKRYPYVIGNILAEIATKRIEEGRLELSDMISLTDNLAKTKPEEVFSLLEVTTQADIPINQTKKYNKKD